MTDLDPDELRRISKTVGDIYSDATVRLLQLVKRRMARGINEPGWAEAKLLEQVGLRADAAEVIARLEDEAIPALRKAIEDAAEFGAQAARQTVGVTSTLKPRANTKAVEALARETITRVTGSHGGILRSVDDIYRSVIAEVSAPGVVSGSESTKSAVQRALNRFADQGITGFVDKAGRNWQLDTYAEMATRTAAGRAMIDGRMETYKADGRRFVIVSNSPEECSMCRPWEGKVLSIDGDGVGTEYGGFRVAGTLAEARSDGLFHPNCTHNVNAVIPGLTRPFESTETPEPARKAAAVAAKAKAEVKRQDRRAAVAMDPALEREAAAKSANAARVAEKARAQEKAAMVDAEAKTKSSADELRQQVAQSAKASKVAKSALDRASKASSTTAQGKAARRLKAGLAVAAVVASLADSDDLTESQELQLAVAAERLARGEITDQEYRRLVREITGTDSRGRRR